jgi:hypothetical protein
MKIAMPATPTGSDPANDSAAPFAVWEHSHTGRRLHCFHDEYLAQRFAVSVSSQIVDNKIAN